MAFDAFLKLDGIPGESTDKAHTGWIELVEFHHGMDQPGASTRSSSGAPAAERVNHTAFTIVKELDKATPKLSVYCCNASPIAKAELEVCRATGEKICYMKYQFENIVITSVNLVGEAKAEGSIPLERVAMNYGKITWTYTETDHKTGKAKGNVEGHWDLDDNTGG